MERCKAQDRIHQGNFEPTDYRTVYDLYLTAFGNKELADRAKAQAAAAYADRHIEAARGAK